MRGKRYPATVSCSSLTLRSIRPALPPRPNLRTRCWRRSASDRNRCAARTASGSSWSNTLRAASSTCAATPGTTKPTTARRSRSCATRTRPSPVAGNADARHRAPSIATPDALVVEYDLVDPDVELARRHPRRVLPVADPRRLEVGQQVLLGLLA